MDANALAKILSNAILKNLDKKTAIAFSGGLDSTTIARVALGKCELALISIGMEGSPDIVASREAASALGLELHEVILNREMLLCDYKKMWALMPGTLVDVELMCAIYEVCRKAKNLGFKKILFGSGAEELFVGYHKYYSALEEGNNLDEILKNEISTLPERDIKRAKKVASLCSVELGVPFMEEELVDAVFSIPAMDRIGPIEMKKPLLREIAKILGVPKIAVERQKKAMQYGSNIHKEILEMARRGEIESWEPREPFDYRDEK